MNRPMNENVRLAIENVFQAASELDVTVTPIIQQEVQAMDSTQLFQMVSPWIASFRPLRGRWSMEILIACTLTEKPRFSTIKESLFGITSKTLSIRLKELHEANIIQREITTTIPVEVRYSLTEYGKRIVTLLRPLVYALSTGVQENNSA